jgi:hypothetical protein
VPLRFATGRHLTGFASLMASPPLRGPSGGSRKNLAIRAKCLPLFSFHFYKQAASLCGRRDKSRLYHSLFSLFTFHFSLFLCPFWSKNNHEEHKDVLPFFLCPLCKSLCPLWSKITRRGTAFHFSLFVFHLKPLFTFLREPPGGPEGVRSTERSEPRKVATLRSRGTP